MRGSGRLPDGLGERFSVAEAASRGVLPGRLRSADLERPFRGVRVRAVRDAASRASAVQAERDDAWQRIMAYAQIMPDHAFFIGPTAALIRGVPMPMRMHEMLHVGVRYPRTPPRRPGIRGSRLRVADAEVVNGLSIATPALTWATLGPFLSEYDLVAATDFLLRIPRSPGGFRALARTAPFATRDDLVAVLRSNRWQSASALRRGLERARTGSSSRPESRVRLMIVDAGLPEPEIDYDIRSGSGMFIACADLAYPDRRLAIEYEGDGHRERAQFEHDINRFARMDEHRWRAVRLTSEHVFRIPHEAIRRILHAYRR